MSSKCKIKLNVDIATFKKGTEIDLECDDNGIPLDAFWRNRLKESAIDNCVTKVVFKKSCKTKKSKEGSKSSNENKLSGKPKGVNNEC